MFDDDVTMCPMFENYLFSFHYLYHYL